jgi:hypothetical protein
VIIYEGCDFPCSFQTLLNFFGVPTLQWGRFQGLKPRAFLPFNAASSFGLCLCGRLADSESTSWIIPESRQTHRGITLLVQIMWVVCAWRLACSALLHWFAAVSAEANTSLPSNHRLARQTYSRDQAFTLANFRPLVATKRTALSVPLS